MGGPATVIGRLTALRRPAPLGRPRSSTRPGDPVSGSPIGVTDVPSPLCLAFAPVAVGDLATVVHLVAPAVTLAVALAGVPLALALTLPTAFGSW